jgi:membrane peptidoglycan carboxypeptidase
VGRPARTAKSLWLRLVLAVVTLAVVVALAGIGYELALPSVANAPARVAAIVRAHNGVIGPLPVPARLGDAVVAAEDEHFYSNVFLNVFDGAAPSGARKPAHER